MHDATEPHADAEQVHLPDNREQIEELEDRILTQVERFGYPKSSRFAIKLALEEAITNAFHHGHKGRPGLTIAVSFSVTRSVVRLVIEDQGPGFKPDHVPDPTLDENIANPSGRGIMLMRAYMTEVRHNQAGNRVELIYRRP